jgi:hypothetical protein
MVRHILISLFFSFSIANANALASCLEQANEALVNHLISDLLAHDFQDLKDSKIRLDCIGSSVDFFSVAPQTSTLFGGKRVYVLKINPDLFNYPSPSEVALKAILAHELSHIVYYKKKNTLQLIMTAVQYVGSHSFQRKFERATDEEAFRRGYGPGLIEFREWLYSRIKNSTQLKKKKKLYYTPDEIILWLEEHTSLSS